MMKTILAARAFVAAAALALGANVALAAFPEKPITLVVPFSPGGSSDTIARAVSVKMQKSLDDVLKQLKAEPGKMSFATSGAGSSDHFTAQLFWQQTGTQGLHVPYKGGGPLVTALLGGQVDGMQRLSRR